MMAHDMTPDTAWEVVRPGVIRLPTTDVEIHMLDDAAREDLYEVRWRDRVIARTMVLGYAKLRAQDWLSDLLAMGMEPG